jgi:hypothetical protein
MSGDTIAGLALSLSGTTISAISGEAWPGEEILTGYANEGQYAMSQASKDGDWTIVDAVISGSGNNKLATGTIAAAGLPNLTAINFIGISDGIYADAATATIQIAGRIDDAQSGLTTGSTYYVQGDGTLSTVAATPSVLAGIAISATKLLIAEGVNVPSLPAVGSSGNLLTSDGTNWSSATAPLELPAAGTAGKLLTSDGTNWVSATAPLELPSAGTTGRLLTSDGTNWISSAHALPDVAGTFEAVASGALADGDKVILRSDGKVEHAVPQGAVAVATDEQGTVLQGVNGDIRNDRWGTTIDFDPLDNNKFVVGYWDSSGATGARLQMVVGTLSGTTISWGTPVDIIAAAPQGGSMISFKFHPTEANLIGVVFGTDGSVATGTSGFGGHFGVATVSGTSLTYTDLLGFDNLQNLGETNVTPHYRYATFSFDWDSQFTGVGFRCAWQHEWQLPYPSGEKFHTASAAIMEILPGLGPVLNASTVSVRLDTRTYTGGVVRIRSCRFDPFTEGKFFATWIRHSYDEPRMHIMQLATNATTFAIGSEVDMGFGQGSYPSNSNITEDDHYCEWNPLTQNQFLFSGRRKHEYGNPNNNSVPELVVGTVSGTSVTFGTNFIYTGDGYGSDSPFQIHWDPTNANRFYAVWSPATNASYYSESIYAQRYILAGTAPNITMTAEGTPTDMTPGPENGHSWTNSFTYLRFNSAMNASGTKLMLNHIFNGDAASTGGYVAASGKTAFTSGGTSVPGVPNLTTANFIGISDGVYADAATATIQTAGVIDDAQSGLTSGSLYYLHDDGTLSTTPDTISVLAGTAISATKLLIAEGINVPVLPTAGIAGKVLKSDGTNWISGDEEEFFTPTFQAEASGSLADGDKVVLLSDGKVKLTSNASTLMAPPSSESQAQTLGVRVPSPNHPVTAQATSSPATSATPSSDTPSQKAWISYDPFDENKFLVAYDDIANGSRPSCRVGIISGTTISFGTAITLHNHTIVEDHSPLAIHFHPTRQNFFACAYAGNGQNMYGDVRAYFGWVAGNSVSFINKFEGFQTGTWRGRRSGTVCFTWDHFSSTNHFVMSWDGLTVASTGPNAGKYAHTESMLVCGTIGATGTPYNMQYPHPGSASFPPRIDVNDDKWWYGLGQVRSCRFDPNTANKFLVTGFKNSSGTSTTPVLYICTTNGALSITTGSEIDLFADIGITGIGEHHCEWNPGIPNQIVFSGQQAFSGTSNHLDPVFCVGTVVGTSVTWGSIFRVVPGASHSGTTSQPWEIFFGASNATGRFYGATSLHPSGGLVGNIDMQAFQITGTTIAAVGATAAIAPHQWFDSFNNASHIGVAFPWHVAVSASGNKFMISHLTGTGSGNHTKFTSGTIFQAGVRNLTSTNFIGISDGVYADGATATIQVAGAIDDAQSGLTPGSIYYLAANGTLSTTPDTDSVLAGTAISATKLLISEGTKQQSNRALGTLLSTHQGLFL